MSLLVDNPILNSPFEEPARYWDCREGQPVLVEGRQGSGVYHWILWYYGLEAGV